MLGRPRRCLLFGMLKQCMRSTVSPGNCPATLGVTQDVANQRAKNAAMLNSGPAPVPKERLLERCEKMQAANVQQSRASAIQLLERPSSSAGATCMPHREAPP